VSEDDVPPYQRSSFDRDYWLSHCEGFTVMSSAGRVGVVKEVRFRSRADRPDVLVVRAGLLGRRTILIAIDDVDEVIPREKRIRLRGAPQPLPNDRPQ
jgi:hypothetical protein